MEGSCSWEQKTLIGELIQGMEFAKQLRQNMIAKASPETREFLVQKILCSYEKALLILKWRGSMGHPNQPQLPQQQSTLGLGMITSLSVPESPISISESPRRDDHDFVRDGCKKRKALPRWTDQVRVSSENGLEGPQDDGYSWRKYGQKDILGAKYPRSYYRCTFRNTQSCWATKQVQRSDEDPFLFDITYRGSHTCSQAGNSVQPPTSPQNQEQKPNNNNTNNIIKHQQFQTLSPNSPSNLQVITEDLQKREVGTSSFSFPFSQYTSLKIDDGFNTHLGLENETFLESCSESFMSLATPESSYYSVSPFQIKNYVGFLHSVHHSESDLTEIISANTSATNSPIPELDFSLDQVEIDPNFPFDTPGFFS